jgi:hypothetical protein
MQKILFLYTDTTVLYYGNNSKIRLLQDSIRELAYNAIFVQEILMFYVSVEILMFYVYGSGLAILCICNS